MAVKAERLGSELVEAVLERIREELPEDEAALCEPFVRQYYRWVPRRGPRSPQRGGAVRGRRRALAAGACIRRPRRDEPAGAEPDGRARRLRVAEDGRPDRLRRHAVHRRLGHDRARPRGPQHRPRDPSGDHGPSRRSGGPDARGARAGRGGARRDRPSRYFRRSWCASPTPSGSSSCATGSSACSTRSGRRSRTGADARPDARARAGLERGAPGTGSAEAGGGGRVPEVGRRRPLHVPRVPRVRPGRARGGDVGVEAIEGSGLGDPAAPAGLVVQAAAPEGDRARPHAQPADPDQGELALRRSTALRTWTTSA